MNIAICDDLPSQSELIHAAAVDYFSRHKEQEVEFSIYNSSLIFLDSLKSTGGFDILLLDICMPGINGTDVAREIRKRQDKCEIVFLTTSDEFAVDAFALKAAHYLLKPFTQELFDEAMDRALARFKNGEVKKIALRPLGGGLQNVDLTDIIYIESSGHTLNIFLKNGVTTECRRSLARILEMLEELSVGQFDAPCKGYIVNRRAIRTIEPKQIVLQNGKTIPIARGSFREFQERHFAYMFPDADCL